SPSIWMMFAFEFFAPSPSEYISSPQLTEQYGQVFRVSVVRDSLNGRTDAASASPAVPKPSAPTLDAASPAPLSFAKPRRLSSILVSPRATPPKRCDSTQSGACACQVNDETPLSYCRDCENQDQRRSVAVRWP